MNLQGPTLADCSGQRRIRKLRERSAIIDGHLDELRKKKCLIEHEIMELEWDHGRLSALVDRPDLGEITKGAWL